MVKYVLVTSQYYHSYHQFICEVTEDFVERARKFIEEIEPYKRDSSKSEKPIYYGDIQDKYIESTKRVMEKGGRRNLNDSGDLYFELSDSIMHLHNEINYNDEHGRMTRKCYKGKQLKEIEKNINEHHDRDTVTRIIEKWFKVL